MARPSEYSPVILPVVKACAAFGATKHEIANYLGISIRSFYSWQLEHAELVEALKKGDKACNDRVIESLYTLAVGWKGSKPDLGAICFWLKNRAPQDWRDVQNINADVGHYILSNAPMTEDEWIAARTKTIEAKVTPTVPQASDGNEIPSSPSDLGDDGR